MYNTGNISVRLVHFSLSMVLYYNIAIAILLEHNDTPLHPHRYNTDMLQTGVRGTWLVPDNSQYTHNRRIYHVASYFVLFTYLLLSKGENYKPPWTRTNFYQLFFQEPCHRAWIGFYILFFSSAFIISHYFLMLLTLSCLLVLLTNKGV